MIANVNVARTIAGLALAAQDRLPTVAGLSGADINLGKWLSLNP